MALSREQKLEIINEYAGKLQRSQALIWANYRAMSSVQMAEFRAQMRNVGAEGMVIKNTLMREALEQVERPVSKEVFDGPCMVALVYGDLAATAKAVIAYARPNEAVFQLQGGIVGRQVITADQVRQLTTLPSREVMLGRVLGTMQAPISSFVGVLGAMLRGFLNVLNARVQQLEGQPTA